MSAEDQIIAYYFTITSTCWTWFICLGLHYLVLCEVFCKVAKVISEGTVNEKDKMVQDLSLAFSYQRGTN